MIGERIGQYVLTRELGRGGMGVVYEAVHETIGHRAAVKVLSSEHTKGERAADYAGRFYDESRAVNIVGHPGIVKIFDFGFLPDQTVFIMMEYLEGESLWDRQLRLQRQSQRYPIDEALRVGRQIASALAAAHDKRIIHRDLKPENIIIVQDPEVFGGERTKVLDFGIARFLDSAKRRTVAGMVMGTALYMAPEQCRGASDIDGKVDVYALGVMLYEALAGGPPFDGEPNQVMVAQLTQEPPPLKGRVPGLSDGVHKLVHQMMAKTAAARPTMAEVVEQIKAMEDKDERAPHSSRDATVTLPSVSVKMSPAVVKALSSAATAGIAAGGGQGQTTATNLPISPKGAALFASAGAFLMAVILGAIWTFYLREPARPIAESKVVSKQSPPVAQPAVPKVSKPTPPPAREPETADEPTTPTDPGTPSTEERGKRSKKRRQRTLLSPTF